MSKPTIICFGEVLWDILPEERLIGGAPLNVGLHIAQFGFDTILISRLGVDKDGIDLRQQLESRELFVELIQADPLLPTGRALVHLQKGSSPTYEIPSPVAWDNIEPDEKAIERIEGAEAFIFGSLCCRSNRSRITLFDYIGLAKHQVFDVNLRYPYFSREIVERLLLEANIVKMNDEELSLIAKWHNLHGSEKSQLQEIRKIFELDIVIQTKGKHGSVCVSESGFLEQSGFPVQVKDTVGSGDAFLAAFLSKYLQDTEIADCLRFASASGAYVASKHGATPDIDLNEIDQLLISV